MKRDDAMKNRRCCPRGAVIGFIAGVSLCIFLGSCSGCKTLEIFWSEIKKALSLPPSSQINAEQIAYATTNMFHLFRDAQYDYVHRHGGTMANSVSELGNGFSIGSHGSLIREEIWLARFDRPENEYVPEAQQSQLERNILARPYRYAILPVQGCNSSALDSRTTCILAVPVTREEIPMLVLFAGPIRSDPADFYRPYPIHKVSDATACEAFRDAAVKGKPVDKAFLDRNLPEWNKPSVSVTQPTSTTKN